MKIYVDFKPFNLIYITLIKFQRIYHTFCLLKVRQVFLVLKENILSLVDFSAWESMAHHMFYI